MSLPVLLVAKNFVKPVAKPAINYPAHDFHRDEQVAIAADPYDTPGKANIFSVDFAGHGFLPIFFVVTNDSDQPVSIANIEITLITAHHSKLTPISPRTFTGGLRIRRGTRGQPDTHPAQESEGHGYPEGDGGDRIFTVRGPGGRAARNPVGVSVF